MTDENVLLKDIGKRVRELRKERGLSQTQFSEQIHISLSHLSDIENGKINLSVDVLTRIIEGFQISSDWLIYAKTPIVDKMIENDIAELLSDCTREEKESILNIIKEVKKISKTKNNL